MRQHVNPLSDYFKEIVPLPPLYEIFDNPNLPLHVDIGSASGDFLCELASKNKTWNYLGIEIREKLVFNANLKIKNQKIKNVHYVFGNANNFFADSEHKFLFDFIRSMSFNFPDPWFKKRHHKRRVIQVELFNCFSNLLRKGTLIFIKTDVRELFEYMKRTISDQRKFRELNDSAYKLSDCFNSNKILTSREKYVLLKNLDIYEIIYEKI